MISLGGIAYFLIIAIVMIYLCVVLVGYRRQSRSKMVVHYPLRVISLAVIGVCFCFLFQLNDVRWDWTAGQLSLAFGGVEKAAGRSEKGSQRSDRSIHQP